MGTTSKLGNLSRWPFLVETTSKLGEGGSLLGASKLQLLTLVGTSKSGDRFDGSRQKIDQLVIW